MVPLSFAVLIFLGGNAVIFIYHVDCRRSVGEHRSLCDEGSFCLLPSFRGCLGGNGTATRTRSTPYPAAVQVAGRKDIIKDNMKSYPG